jgi:purine-binding chemotaxis protein CheW
MDFFKAVIFKVNHQELGLNISQVISIERMLICTKIPTTADCVKGIVTIRGIVTPIIDLRIALGHDNQSETDSTRIVVINFQDKPIGLVVDEATDVMDMSYESIQHPDMIKEIHFITGVCRIEERLILLIDAEKMLENMDAIVHFRTINMDFANTHQVDAGSDANDSVIV